MNGADRVVHLLDVGGMGPMLQDDDLLQFRASVQTWHSVRNDTAVSPVISAR